MGQRYWQQAERDLEAARALVKPRFSYIAASLAHQVAEKALKAACWHLRGQEPPWRHNLRQTAELAVENPQDIPPAVYAAIQLLEPVFGKTRYPSGRVDEPIPAELIDEDVARAAVESAEEVMVWAQTLLQRPPGRA